VVVGTGAPRLVRTTLVEVTIQKPKTMTTTTTTLRDCAPAADREPRPSWRTNA
jgi:hypothetical protein